MDGMWRIYGLADRWTGGPPHYVRAVIRTTDVVAVGYRLASVDVFTPSEATTHLQHLGPDLLGPEWQPETAVANLRAEPTAEIGCALLDQRRLAGIGNVYKSELCFIAGVNPWTPVAEVPDLESMVANAHDLLMANRTSSRRVTTGDGRRPLWVYTDATANRAACAGLRSELRRRELLHGSGKPGGVLVANLLSRRKISAGCCPTSSESRSALTNEPSDRRLPGLPESPT